MSNKQNASNKPPDDPGSDPLAICACNNLRRASRAVTQFFDDKLQAIGLRSTQLVILLAVMQNDNAGIAQLARVLGMNASTLNRNLRPLTRENLVKISDGPTGQRKTVSLTKAGRRAIEDATPIWQTAQQQITDHLGQERYSGLLGDLGLIVDATRG